ncbi:putative uncharacterized protein [Clostridium sp. CAG:575]|nr:putative uncharacterized protein [Clostridium sp. CAG:575]
MKVLNELSIKDLKLNRKRSIVIIIGIILSTALICGVAGLVSSFQQTLVETVKNSHGNYHAIFYDVPKEELKYIENNRNVENYYLSEDLGVSYLPKIELATKKVTEPYINVIAMDNKFLDNMAIKIHEGRLPENDTEIAVSVRINDKYKLNYKVGDTITLNLGERQLSTGEKLTKIKPYLTGEEDNGEILKEELVNTTERTYKIVGIIERPSYAIESYESPWFTAITKMEKVEKKANIAVLYTNLQNYIKNTEEINKMVKATEKEKQNENNTYSFGGLKDKYSSYKYELCINEDLLRFEGVNLSESTLTMIYGLAGFIMAIVLVSSVFVIRNGFAISITERLKQYGMLSSIGATKKQIKKSVYFEGFILGLIGIPLGIFAGIFAIYVLVNLVNFILKDYISNSTLLVYSMSWVAVSISILVSTVTIWLSCKSSARRASKITPIEAIRSSNDIKLEAKKIKCPKIITKIFKTGGEIAYKNLKRSKKKYRTTVVSIIVSVVIFIAISSFIEYGFKMSGAYYTELNYNYAIYSRSTVSSKDKEEFAKVEAREKEMFNEISKFDTVDDYSINKSATFKIKIDDQYKEKLTEYGKKVRETTGSYEMDEEGNKKELDFVTIISLSQNQYEKYVKKIGGTYENYKDGAILIDNSINYDSNGKRVQGSKYTWKKGDIIHGQVGNKDYDVKIVARTEERPMGVESLYSTNAYFIVSEEFINGLEEHSLPGMYIQSKKVDKLDEQVENYMKENNITENTFWINNINEAVKEQNAVILVISIFLYGFITVITLIGITNIFNTITTNMNLRKKEFAMLKSIGMTKKEFNRMIRLESIFYGVKSLVIGIPIGILLSYGIYNIFKDNMEMEYVLPIKAIVMAIVFVAIVIGIIMKYSMNKINKQNIIETIRNDNI